MEMKWDVIAIGEILMDMVPQGTDTDGDSVFTAKAGGAPLNMLAAATARGAKTAFIGMVGADMFGIRLRSVVREAGVDDALLRTSDSYNTTLAFVTLDETGDRDFSFYRAHNADVQLTLDDVDLSCVEHTKVLHFGSLSFTNEPLAGTTKALLDAAKKAQCIITYDPNYRAPLWKSEEEAIRTIREYVSYADIAKISLEEAQMITKEADMDRMIASIREMGPKIVLITDGGNGVHFAADETVQYLPSMDVATIDTTGAGDIFFGTFMAAFLQNEPSWETVSSEAIIPFVEKAIRASGISTTRHGAIASIPGDEEL